MSFKVLTGLFAHETNTFSKLPTTLDNFRNFVLAFDDDVAGAVKGSMLEIVGAQNAAATYGWELVHSVAAWATPSGPVSREVWDTCAGHFLNKARNTPDLDGILLALHGAMVTEDYPDGEGELLRQLREVVGPNIPIAITVDLHANITDQMVKHATIISAFRTYPHTDQVETAERAGDLLHKTMRGEIFPVCTIARRPQLTGFDHGRTTIDNPMTTSLGKALTLEQQNDAVLMISILAGFTAGDIEQTGPSVCVMCDNDRKQAQAIAENFMDYAWETRHFDSNTYLDVPSGLSRMNALLNNDDEAKRPVVIADFSDNPGSGAYGDSTFLLQGLLDANITNATFGMICDPEAVKQLIEAGIGATARIHLGGRIDPHYGPPIEITGEVINLTEGTYVAQGPRWRGVTQYLGRTAVFRSNGIDIIVTSNRVQCTELETFTHAGIDPAECSVVVVKSMQHFRAVFEPIAREVLIVDAGALASKEYSKLSYTRLRRPIYPLDLD